MSKGVCCPHCGRCYLDHINVYGKVCRNCGGLIGPSEESPLIRMTEERLKKQQEKIRNSIRRKLNKGGT